MKIAFYDTKPYDKIWFEPVAKEKGFEINFFEEKLNEKTASWAKECDAVCIFVNDNAVALAFGRTVYITNSLLEDKKTVKSETSIKQIALFNDNEHLFVVGNSDWGIIK